jgi:hypothetical protein
MNTPHDLIMAVYETRKAAKAALRHRSEVNESEWQRLHKEARGKIGPINGGRLVTDGDEHNTPASKAAHEAYTTASHRAGAAMRELMKYGKKHSYSITNKENKKC